jgi:hypothetical protein
MRILISLLLLSILVAGGCEKQGIVEEDKFVLVYADLLTAQDTTSVQKVKSEIFKRHNISEKEYQETVDYYNSNPEKWDTFFNKVITYIEEKKQTPSSKR